MNEKTFNTRDYKSLIDAFNNFFKAFPDIDRDEIARINVGSAGVLIEKDIVITNSA